MYFVILCYSSLIVNNNGERLTKMSEFQLKTCNYVPVVTSLQYPQVKYNYIKGMLSVLFLIPRGLFCLYLSTLHRL